MEIKKENLVKLFENVENDLIRIEEARDKFHNAAIHKIGALIILLSEKDGDILA